MGDNGTETHEILAALPAEVQDFHRAVASLKEELEAVDWYQQRAAACTDAALRQILVHNRNEEIEHAMMLLEWLRRHDATFDQKARRYLFAAGPIAGAEPPPGSAAGVGADGLDRVDLGIGSLKVKGGT